MKAQLAADHRRGAATLGVVRDPGVFDLGPEMPKADRMIRLAVHPDDAPVLDLDVQSAAVRT